MPGALKKSLDRPDERIQVEGVAADVVQIGDASVSRNVFQVGAHCALNGRTLPGNRRADASCMAHHTGVLLDGALHIEMDDGSTLDLGPNDVFDIPAGHDGWVTGDRPMKAINWSGVRTWMPAADSGDLVIATILFTDIVGSTRTAERLGPAAWHELLRRHNHEIRVQLDRFRGREIETTGDGFLAIFESPARAVRAAIAIREALRAIGIEVRQGLHTGEVELLGDKVRGIAVHEASRVMAAAGSGEILASATVRQLASGADLTFEGRGAHDLKGLSGPRELFAVATPA